MKPRYQFVSWILFIILSPWQSSAGAEVGLAHLQRSGSVTQLLVDGHPWILLAGELHNSSSSSLAYLQPLWPRLTALNLNTVIASLSWELVEPEDGKFDFSLADGIIEAARRWPGWRGVSATTQPCSAGNYGTRSMRCKAAITWPGPK